MEYIIIALTAFGASLLTFFAGFGLGTIMLPVFALFFPIEVAVSLTAIVHLLNNLFKIGLVGKHINKEILVRFGVLAILGAFAGAWLLTKLAGMQFSIYEYEWLGRQFSISPLALTIGLLMCGFAVLEYFSLLKEWKLPAYALYLGGLLSGFFGGLSGHQGALRSAFLVKVNLSKEAFIATGVAVACLVDVIRLSIYSSKFALNNWANDWPILLVAVLAAFGGAYLGKKLLQKTKVEKLYKFVAFMLMAFGLLMASGLISKV